VYFGYRTSQTSDPGPFVTLTAFTQPALTLDYGVQAANLSWISRLGTRYQPQWSTNLTLDAAGWDDLGDEILGDGFRKTVPDSPSGQPLKFYRLKIYPPN
jgi:hypothetical protein